ncbi:NADP-dependent oxidoreductase domain-containing protein [Aspergillus filifer]
MAKPLTIKSTQKLLSGYEIPVLGYGVYQTPTNVAEKVTAEALKLGYRHIDSAAAYKNEKEVAAAISTSGFSRSSIFLTTKIPPKANGYQNAKRSIDESLKQAGTDYFDLILIHAPYGGKTDRLGTWDALVEAQKSGKTRSIGVSNFGVHHLNELQEHISATSSSPIDVGQYELHPWLARPDIVSWLRNHGAVVEAYSPLVRNTRSNEPVLKELGGKHGKSAAQVLVRWSLQMGFVPLPKSVTPERIRENADVFDFELDGEDMKRLETGMYEPCAWDPTVDKD